MTQVQVEEAAQGIADCIRRNEPFIFMSGRAGFKEAVFERAKEILAEDGSVSPSTHTYTTVSISPDPAVSRPAETLRQP